MSDRRQGEPVVCSCGVPGCTELGWPHEWDPVAAGDSCAVTPPPAFIVQVGDIVVATPQPHHVAEPFVRWGSGYACAGCVEFFAEPALEGKQ